MSYDYLEIKTFNELNQLIEEKLIGIDGVIHQTKNIYNQEEQVIQNIVFDNNEVSHDFSFTYYDKGLLKTIGEDYFEYKYDEKGNFIWRARYSEFGLSNVLKREMEYY